MTQKINYCTVYTMLWCLMHLKGVLYHADIISVIFYGMVMLMSLYCFGKVLLLTNQPTIIKVLNVLTIMFILYGGMNIIAGGAIHTSWNIIPADFYLKNILNSILPIYAYYYFAKNGYITKKWIFVFAFIFLAIGLGRYYVGMQKAMALRMFDTDEVTNNAGYIILALMPLACFFNKRPILQYAYLAVCMLLIVGAMKRGAILIGVLCLVLFLFRFISSVPKKQKVIYLLLSVVIVCVSYYYILYMIDTSAYFDQRIQDTLNGHSSQRDTLYSYFLNFMFDRNIFFILLGQGADTTVRFGPNYAHNDWLEIGVNQGLLGVAIYTFFMYQLFAFWQRAPKKSTMDTALGMIFIIFFCKSFLSMAVNNMELYISLVLGYSIACSRNDVLLKDALS